MPKISRNDLIKQLTAGALRELSAFRVEFKAKWKKEFGEDISAIANQVDRQGGWLIVGVNDNGTLPWKTLGWAEKEESA